MINKIPYFLILIQLCFYFPPRVPDGLICSKVERHYKAYNGLVAAILLVGVGNDPVSYALSVYNISIKNYLYKTHNGMVAVYYWQVRIRT